MFFKIRRLRTRLELVFTVLKPDRNVSAVWLSPGFRLVSASVPVCTCILLQRASCDFVLRRLRGGSP